MQRLSVSIPEDLYFFLQRESEKTGLSMNAIVRQLLAAHFDRSQLLLVARDDDRQVSKTDAE